MEKLHTITAANGAIVNVVLDHIDGDGTAAIEVALACINANDYFDATGDIYDKQHLSTLVNEHWGENFDKVTDGSSSGYMMQIAGYSVLWHSGISKDCCLTIAPIDTTIEQWVRRWDDNGREYAESWGFGWGDESDEVGSDYWGEVVIQIHPNFYEGTLGGRTTPHLLRDEDWNVIIFDDYQAAQDWIDEQKSEEYVLAHGEYDRPDYKIIQASIVSC